MSTEEAVSPNSPDRRSSDARHPRFEADALKKVLPAHLDFDPAEIETIDMDAALPPGHVPDEHLHVADPATATPRLSPEQNRARLQIVKFKHSFEDFQRSEVSQLAFAQVKRGDVVEIKTIVGSIYLRVIDRIKGLTPGVGELLCECRYDLPDQWTLAHAASVTLPFCRKDHLIVNADGSQRCASRALKMTAEEALPEVVTNLLRESFFVEIIVHATPEPDKLRVIDIGRWLLRIALRIKGWFVENNRREREKEEQQRERKRQKEEARRQKREAAQKK